MQLAVSNPTADAIENTFGTQWDRGNSCEVICKYTDSIFKHAVSSIYK